MNQHKEVYLHPTSKDDNTHFKDFHEVRSLHDKDMIHYIGSMKDCNEFCKRKKIDY